MDFLSYILWRLFGFKIVGSRLPKFSEEESLMVIGDLDFIALNHYAIMYVANGNLSSPPMYYYTNM
eukprot:Gb_26352 [translate_table: standard]